MSHNLIELANRPERFIRSEFPKYWGLSGIACLTHQIVLLRKWIELSMPIGTDIDIAKAGVAPVGCIARREAWTA
jgi:hypothetical protein